MGQPGGEPYDPNTGYPPPMPPVQYPGQYPSYGGQYPPQQPMPGYPAPHYPGYPPPPGYPGAGYPMGGFGPQRPGPAMAAAVLAYVAAGLLIAGGILLFIGASVVNDFSTLTDNGHSLLTAELVLDGILNLIAGGLLIAGAVSFTGGANNGRILLSVGSGIVIALSIYWIARTSGSATVWALIFAALVIVALSMAWTGTSSAWLRAVDKGRIR
jgi:hypothetical protein